jgi:hypothetical protein
LITRSQSDITEEQLHDKVLQKTWVFFPKVKKRPPLLIGSMTKQKPVLSFLGKSGYAKEQDKRLGARIVPSCILKAH